VKVEQHNQIFTTKSSIMKSILFLALVLFSFAACDTPETTTGTGTDVDTTTTAPMDTTTTMPADTTTNQPDSLR
jgi:hypothetical protein